MEDKSYKLILSVMTGDLKSVRSVLKNGSPEEPLNVNAGDKLDSTLLMIAAREGHLEIARILVEKGAEVDATDNDGWTALMYAAWKGHLEVARFLIGNGAEVDASEFVFGATALTLAAENGHTEVVRFLVESGANVNLRGVGNWNPMEHAALNGHLEVTKLLLDNGTVISAKEIRGLVRFIRTTNNGDQRAAEVVKFLDSVSKIDKTIGVGRDALERLKRGAKQTKVF